MAEGHATTLSLVSPGVLGDDTLLTEPEVLQALKISRQTRWRLTRDKKLPAVAIGNAVRFRVGDVRALVQAAA